VSADTGPQAGQRLRAGRGDKGVLVAEMGVESAVREPELAHHRRDARAAEAVLPKAAAGRGDDARACVLLVVDGVSHRGSSASNLAGTLLYDDRHSIIPSLSFLDWNRRRATREVD
jgi:hypothetical protein